MDCFKKFDPLTGVVPGFPFSELWRIVGEARILLAGLSVKDIWGIEIELDNLLTDGKDDFAKYCFNARVMQEDEPDYMDDDFSDVEALRMLINCGKLGDVTSEHSYPVQCAAVLALMRVADCLSTMDCPEEELGTHDDGPIAARLLFAANKAVESALAIGYANELAALTESEAEAAEELAGDMEKMQKRFSEDRARKAAAARHDHLKPAIDFVQTEWRNHSKAYNSNKTDFARTYVELVRNRYRDRRGDPLKITIKTITDIWLAPAASRPAGDLADG